MAGDSTIEVTEDNRAFCAQCGEGKPREPTADEMKNAADALEIAANRSTHVAEHWKNLEAFLDENSVTEEEGRKVCEELGIDVEKWAEELRRKVDEAGK
jgi:signal recognition particle subunit SEC65